MRFLKLPFFFIEQIKQGHEPIRIKSNAFLTICLFSLVIFVLNPKEIHAQEDATNRQDSRFKKALELYDHQVYADAAQIFGQISRNSEESITTEGSEDKLGLERINAAFYEALCEMRLGNQHGEQKLLSLIRQFPYIPLASQAGLQLGFFHFSKANYYQTVKYLDASKTSLGDPLLQDERDFKLGYSLFKLKKTEEARPLFYKLIDHKGPYQEDALYYSAHLAYEKKDYETALTDLKRISSSSPYAEILPVYSSQIYLLKGDLANARLVSESALKSANRYRPLIEKSLGSVDFFESKFKESALHFDVFKQSEFSMQETNQDIYQIGYSYYKNGSYDRAIKELGQLYDKQDIYAQSGLYTLGQSYLRKGENQNARSAFQLASSLTGNSDINKNALIYYLKLSYEEGLDQDALNASKSFIKNYPKASELAEVKTLQANILFNAHNYKEAYETLKSIPITVQSEKAFQKISYFYGIQTYNENNNQDALKLLQESLSHPFDPDFVSLALYWKAESLYNLKEYEPSAHTFQEFLTSAAVSNSGLNSDGIYGLGYAFFKLNDFNRALSSFEKFQVSANKDANMKNDVSLRMADCYFMLKNYSKAKVLYFSAASNHVLGADYSMFQSGLLQGLQNNQAGKLVTLGNLLKDYPNSSYAPDALYEIAYSHFLAGKLDLAKNEFNTLISRFPSSNAIPRSLLNLGLISYNSNDDNTALNYYKDVISKYPGSPESKNALAAIKNIYIEKGTPEAFVNYANSSGTTPVSQTGVDSITYQSANTKYLKGDIAGSIKSFDSYLISFPNGYFASDAHYYRSQALQRLKKPEEALSDYIYLISKSTNNSYIESAVSQAASIYVSENKCDFAIPLLRRLESSARDKENSARALSSLSSCYFQMNSLDSAQIYAEKLIAIKGAPIQEQSLAELIIAKCLLIKKDSANALKPLFQAAKARNASAAESKYLIALIQYGSNNYKSSMKTIFELAKQLANYDYWVAKSFILLSDNYRAQGDLFQAKSTLLSIVRNYKPEDEVRNEAEQKLNKLQAISK